MSEWTVAQIIRILKELPSDAKVWAYEGEVSGIIISGKKVSATIHNEGLVEIKDKVGQKWVKRQ